MIRVIDLRGHSELHESTAEVLVPRADFDVEDAGAVVAPILADVKLRGEVAVQDWSERLDGVRPEHVRVPQSVIDEAVRSLDPRLRSALEEAIRRVRIVHEDQRRNDVVTEVVPGGTVTERWIPVDRVGLYVPGGRAVYPSSVVMNVVPAQIAGVGSLAIVSPPQRENDGYPNATILAACGILGVHEVYAAGGAQAVAMLAYGTTHTGGTCRAVDLVTGPGNIYVTAAKRMLKGIIGIDSEAGPTEIAILADHTAVPAHVAADLISQAEHDTIAASVLVTTSQELADAVKDALREQVAATKHVERITEALGGRQSAIVLVDDLDAGIHYVNAYAAEHLEIHTQNARDVAMRITNAGAIFVGANSPVSLGDYAAGSNHVLPTSGTAKHSSGLSVQSFLRGVHIIEYDETALAQIADDVVTLAHAEDLPGHAAAIQTRTVESS